MPQSNPSNYMRPALILTSLGCTLYMQVGPWHSNFKVNLTPPSYYMVGGPASPSYNTYTTKVDTFHKTYPRK
eukprot:12403337-Ditylum_brightwellii.AAC.1